MDKFVVKGPGVLKGVIPAGGSKNCALPVLFATLLTDKKSEIQKVPELEDMTSTAKLLEHFGTKIEKASTWIVDASKISSLEAPYDLVRKMRASFYAMGPLLARFGSARVSMPGGCAIGARPIDLHLMAFEKLGAVITQSSGYVEAKLPEGQKKLIGGTVVFPLVSVGATANVMMAATLADGETILQNAAQEPEIRDLAEALISMGAKIKGHGSSVITITGVNQLNAMKFTVPADRIEAATYLIAAHLSGGDVEVTDAKWDDMAAVLDALKKSGAQVEKTSKGIRCVAGKEILPVDITTAPFPGFPTDVQAQWVTLMTNANGDSVVEETIFENRFMHVPELNRMGARIDILGSAVRIKGQRGCLEGAPVMATDLRASASLVIAGVVARGETQVKRIYHLDRGYESMEDKLSTLGGQVARVKDE